MPAIKLKSINRENICTSPEYDCEYDYLANHLNEWLPIWQITFCPDGTLNGIAIVPDKTELDTPVVCLNMSKWYPLVDFELKGVTLDEDIIRPDNTEA